MTCYFAGAAGGLGANGILGGAGFTGANGPPGVGSVPGGRSGAGTVPGGKASAGNVPGGTAPAGSVGFAALGGNAPGKKVFVAAGCGGRFVNPRAALVSARELVGMMPFVAGGANPETFGLAIEFPAPVCVPRAVFIPPAAASGAK